MNIGRRWMISEGGRHNLQKAAKESRLVSISIKTEEIKGLILTIHYVYQRNIKDVQGCEHKASRSSVSPSSALKRQLQWSFLPAAM